VRPEPVWAGLSPRRGAGRWPRLIGTVAAVALIGALGVATASGAFGNDPLQGLTATPIASPSVSEEILADARTPRPSPTPVATASPSPTPLPPATPLATATPSVDPTPSPVPPPAQRTYTVAPGDTLGLIANRFGTTVEALMAANGLSDPDRIVEGQILTIP
jgi:LysM repeat protein